MVDRSIVNSEFNVDRDVGLTVYSRDLFGLGVLRYSLGLFVGEGRDYLPGRGRDDSGFLYTARVEVNPLGSFEDYTEADLERNGEPRLSFGLAYAFLDEAGGIRGIRGAAPRDGGTSDYHFVAADLVLMVHGLSLHTEAIYRTGTRAPGGLTDGDGAQLPIEAPRHGIGWFFQIGYLLPEVDFEASARFGLAVPVGPSLETSMPDRHELGLGLGYYLDGHTFKVQLDVFHLWDEVDRFEQGDQRVRLSFQAFI